MGDRLETQIINYISSKGDRFKGIERQLVVSDSDQQKNKAVTIANLWTRYFANSRNSIYVSPREFFKSMASIDDGANVYPGYGSTNDYISEIKTEEAFEAAKEDLKKITDEQLSLLNNVVSKGYRNQETDNALKEAMLKFPQKVRTYIECLLRDRYIGNPPKIKDSLTGKIRMIFNGFNDEDDWNFGGTGTRKVQDFRTLDSALDIEIPLRKDYAELKLTNKGANVSNGGEVVLDQSMFDLKGARFKDSYLSMRPYFSNIKGGKLYMRVTPEGGPAVDEEIKENEDNTLYFDGLDNHYLSLREFTQHKPSTHTVLSTGKQTSFKVVFKHDKNSTTPPSFDFEITTSKLKKSTLGSDATIVPKQTFNLRVDGNIQNDKLTSQNPQNNISLTVDELKDLMRAISEGRGGLPIPTLKTPDGKNWEDAKDFNLEIGTAKKKVTVKINDKGLYERIDEVNELNDDELDDLMKALSEGRGGLPIPTLKTPDGKNWEDAKDFNLEIGTAKKKVTVKINDKGLYERIDFTKRSN